MKTAPVASSCECQARLHATVDDEGNTLSGSASHRRRRRPEKAPATRVGPVRNGRFDIGWMCPFCGRNVLRSFEMSGLVFTEVAAAEAPAAEGDDDKPTAA